MTVGPTTRRRQLGADLRRLRERKGLTLEEAGALVGISKATLSRYERKEGTVKWPAVDALCREYGTTDDERSSLVELAKGARIQGWWRSLADPVPESMNLMLTLEDEVVSEDHYACMYVPGLLQTHAYAEAVHRASEMRCSDQEIAHMVDIRMKRQELLERPEPPHIWAVVDEAVIRRVVGGRETMRAQLHHLLEQARRPHVTVQILPFETGAHAAAVGSFVVLGGPTPELDVVYVDIIGGGLFMEKPQELSRYKRAFCPGRSVWERSAGVDDCGVLVQVEAVGKVADGRATVRVRSEVGAAAAFWCGGPTGVGREHHVEWTVEEDAAWGGNTRPATSISPGVDEKEGDRIVFRGRLGLTGDGGATLEVAGTHILFDLADPPPSTAVDGTWVEISVERNSVSLWPYLL